MASINDEYEKLMLIGQGSFASIWKVRHRKYGYIRTLKILNTPIQDENDRAYQQFVKECTVLLNIGNGANYNIVHIYQPRLIDNRAVVEMDFIDGETLDQYLRRNKFMPIDEVLRFIGDIGGALAYCHHDIYKYMMNPNEDDLKSDPDDGRRYIIDEATEQRLVRKYAVTHNDLHSNNVMRRENDGSYVLLDFGLAIQNGTAVKSSALRGGALEYMAPEKFDDNNVITTQSDIYSFGILMYEALAGRVPFVLGQGASFSDQTLLYQQHKAGIVPEIEPLRREAFEAANPGQTYHKDYPDWLEDLITRCLEKNPANRFADAKELMNEYKRRVASKPVAELAEATDEVPPATPANLIACPDCGKMISKKATACPYCGRPLQQTPAPPQTPVPPKDGKSKSKSKKWIWWLIGGIVALAAVIVGIVSSQPKTDEKQQIKETALSFLEAFNNMDFDGAKKYATSESAEQLDALATLAAMGGATEAPKFDVEITEVEINGEDATANYTLKAEGKDAEEAALKLKKVDGKWLAVYQKEGFGGSEEDDDEDNNSPNVPAGFVDLGLLSGTLWKKQNETNPNDDHDFYTYDEAVKKYGDQLPTKAQLRELKDKCTWTWDARKKGYKVAGRNGNSIFLPAAGFRINGTASGVGYNCGYWSSTPYDSEYAWYLYFDCSKVSVDWNYRPQGQSVRLVQD